jgi:hypothetical protein
MKALTLHQPWAYAVAHLGKDIENRTWRPPAALTGQRVAIHAAKQWDYQRVWDIVGQWGTARLIDLDLLDFGQIDAQRGHIIATAIVSGVVTSSASPWWCGPLGWQLTDVRTLVKPVACKGAQGLWTVPVDVLAAIEVQGG